MTAAKKKKDAMSEETQKDEEALAEARRWKNNPKRSSEQWELGSDQVHPSLGMT